jgi:hypothetical protein
VFFDHDNPLQSEYCYKQVNVGIEVASPSFLLRFYYLSGSFGDSARGG